MPIATPSFKDHILEQTILDVWRYFWWFFLQIQDCFESVTPSSDEKVKTFLEKACKALIAAKVEFLGRTRWGDSTVWCYTQTGCFSWWYICNPTDYSNRQWQHKNEFCVAEEILGCRDSFVTTPRSQTAPFKDVVHRQCLFDVAPVEKDRKTSHYPLFIYVIVISWRINTCCYLQKAINTALIGSH